MEKVSEGSGAVNLLYRTAPGPTAEPRCEECGSHFHVSKPTFQQRDRNADIELDIGGRPDVV